MEVTNIICDRMTISPEIPSTLPILKSNGFRIVIISGGLDVFVNRLKGKYNLDYGFSNKVEIKDNRLTGSFIPPILNARVKQQTLLELTKMLRKIFKIK